jgi:SAM domain (Sterile alpha motif)
MTNFTIKSPGIDIILSPRVDLSKRLPTPRGSFDKIHQIGQSKKSSSINLDLSKVTDTSIRITSARPVLQLQTKTFVIPNSKSQESPQQRKRRRLQEYQQKIKYQHRASHEYQKSEGHRRKRKNKQPKTPKKSEILKWITEDVLKWLKKIEFPELQSRFKEEEITGKSLLQLREHHLHKLGIIKLGKKLSFLWELKQLH